MGFSFCGVFKFSSIILIEIHCFRINCLFSINASEHVQNQFQYLFHCLSWLPFLLWECFKCNYLGLDHVLAQFSFLWDIRMEDGGGELELRSLEGVIFGESDEDSEFTTYIWSIGRTNDCGFPSKDEKRIILL